MRQYFLEHKFRRLRLHKSCSSKREPRGDQSKISVARVDRLQRRILLKRRERGKGKQLRFARGGQWGARRNCRVGRWGGPVIGGGEAAGAGMFTKPIAHEISLDHDGALVYHCGFDEGPEAQVGREMAWTQYGLEDDLESVQFDNYGNGGPCYTYGEQPRKAGKATAKAMS